MLEIKDLTKYYGNRAAVYDIFLNMGPGELIGLFGENGAGKTTLMKCILGLTGFKGSVTLDGEPITRRNIARLSFATSEHSFFPGLSAKGHSDFYREHFPRYREKRFKALMDFFELPLSTPLRSFSTGQKNQFEVIMALSQGADYILMDEPFAGNDIFNREDFYKLLLGILEPTETIMLSTHLIEEVSGFIDRAVLIHKGTIIGDKKASELEDEGSDLMEYIKKTYNYRPDRVAKALQELEDGGR
jgi:ABC-2 type transport system ATP-binding protein